MTVVLNEETGELMGYRHLVLVNRISAIGPKEKQRKIALKEAQDLIWVWGIRHS